MRLSLTFLALLLVSSLSGCLSIPDPIVGTWEKAESSPAGAWGSKIVGVGGEKSVSFNEDKTFTAASGKTGHWAEREGKYIKVADAEGVETIYFLETSSALYYLGTMDEADHAINGLVQGYSLGSLSAKDELKVLVRYRKGTPSADKK